MPECGFAYRDGRVCDGQLYVYRRSGRGIPYVLCEKKGNHGMSLPDKPLPASYWSYPLEEFQDDPGLPPY